MNSEARGAAKARCEAATEGPWHGPHDEYGCVHIGDYGWEAGYDGRYPRDGEDSEQGKADAEFIAHARTDLPVALAMLEAIEIEIAGWSSFTAPEKSKIRAILEDNGA